jgi:hypothetical protein
MEVLGIADLTHSKDREQGDKMPETNNQQCKCPYPCSRHGNCKACQEYHKKDGSKTNCGKNGKENK